MVCAKNVLGLALAGSRVLNRVYGSSLNAEQPSVPLDLTSYFNNQGFGTYPGESSFGALNESYPSPSLNTNSNTASPLYTSSTGIQYHAPRYLGPSTPDNVICANQTISVPPGPYFAISLLHSCDLRKKTALGTLTFHYTDNTTSTAELRSEPWWAFLTINRGEIVYDSYFGPNYTNHNTSHIFEYETALAPGKVLNAITLPSTTNTTEGRIHVFSMSLWRGRGVDVQSVRPTQKSGAANGTQVVEVVVNNAGAECVHGAGIEIELTGKGVQTVEVGRIKRLCPGDQKRVDVSVSGSCTGDIKAVLTQAGQHTHSRTFANLTLGLTSWNSTSSNLARHESPAWFDAAKFGIFIHWGPYSVPSWGNSTPYESYAEWFWWYGTHSAADKSGFRDYRLRTFGPDWNYDDTFPDFTAARYNPQEWVDLIADAGAKYFVITTKHHDGFALFDAGKTTNRTALHYGPQRDIVKDLFDAAKEFQPELKRGTYFSLPEWFNPSWGKYGFSQYNRPDSTTHPGIIARNPFTNLTEPYTGHIEVEDFIQDVMVPQMDILAYEYDSDVMWCDAGASNGTADFAARWFEHARSQGRDVTINSRCGTAEANDFDTPEYATFATAQRRKWESNRGMDPFSYGFNRATPDSEYMNATTLITTLVDMVSKNGNLLLNIGPKADGTIPQVEIDNLREAGKWIKSNEEAIFNTTYWFRKAEDRTDGSNVRFTQTNEAFYILSLERPMDGRLVVEAPIPILKGDTVSLVGHNASESLKWEVQEEVLTIQVDESVVGEVNHCWVFKILYSA
ncbi:glycoside hydrolase family 29 protein [Melanomma pulvis-pyrius CBS 109.77]|uniref:alpha-L-fucosidase n=1 Tax=Melanomma pulvis-pyrius CBS 109.77 TaxID=1314802 RepID=A0A6A6X1X3_9PLEO|nr:glycoside hydrolase family 29 protein [Melanomma pulvis-pyrius CBS 109.77]